MLNKLVYDFNLISVLLERISSLSGSCLLVKMLTKFSNTVGYGLWKGNNGLHSRLDFFLMSNNCLKSIPVVLVD